jgi:hypothetical protein
VTPDIDRANGRPLRNGREVVEELLEHELEQELTVALHDPVRRTRRFDLLVAELIRRRDAVPAAH